jgi:hypothetical protein
MEGPMSSSAMATRLVQNGLNAEAARKRVSRVKSPARALFGLTLPKNGRFLYHEQDYGSDLFRTRLTTALKSSGSAYARALIGLEAQGGAVPEEQFTIISGLPFRDTKKQLRHDVVEAKLRELSLIGTVETPDGRAVALRDGSTLSKRRRAERIVEEVLLGIIKTHLGRMNITSYHAGMTRGTKLPAVGQFHWDFTAPAYMAGLSHFDRIKGIQPGFVVGDILLGREVSKNMLVPFFGKLDALLRQGRATRIAGFFAADFFEREALDELRRRGCLVLTPETLYGREFAFLLQQLALKIENASAALANDPDAFFSIIRQLMKIEGAALNLRGVVMELMVAQIYAHDGYRFDLRRKVRTATGGRAEIDVKADNRVECVCVECKANLSGNLVTKQEIEEWIDQSLPLIKAWLKEKDSTPERVRFEFFTATEFEPDAKQLIEDIERNHIRQPIRFFTGLELTKRLRERKLHSLLEIYNEHFGITMVPDRKSRRAGSNPPESKPFVESKVDATAEVA